MLRKISLLIVIVFLVQAQVFALDAVTFDDKGIAEVSSYRIAQPRYGELRHGKTVLVFVTEDMNKKTRIKIEDYRVPQSEYVKVLKLIKNLSFNTGIYDYQVQTSSFLAIDDSRDFTKFSPLKFSISAHEWCGNFFAQLIPHKNFTDFIMHSYFEKEGDQGVKIPTDEGSLYEDALWVLIRELDGEWLKEGERKELKIMPALWQSRMTHKPLEFEKGWIEKKAGKDFLFQGKSVKTYQWRYAVGNREVTISVQAGDGNLILAWTGTDGEEATIIDSLNLDYWRYHSNKDLYFREKLGL